MTTAPRRNRHWTRLLGIVLFAVFFALGSWQVQRRAWKLELIERVEARVHADPVDPPGKSRWGAMVAADEEYRRVRIEGSFIQAAPAFVQAVTERGAGYWALSPLLLGDGNTVLVNRGLVTSEGRRDLAVPAGRVTVIGLLRLTEPGGGFLRKNDPAADRWYSRDVQAIAAARGLASVAPYFVDAQRTEGAMATGTQPIPGLTVVSFHNSHLVYAVTWYTLAVMVAAGAWRLERERQT